jgi:hypothetical protein
MMDVVLSKEKADRQECSVLVIGFFKDERPLGGATGLIDWRLNGMLSRLLLEEKLTGEWKETILIPSQGRIIPRMILLLGLGAVREYSYPRVRELSAGLLETLKKLDATDVCLSLPHGEGYNVDCGKLAEVLIEGITDCSDLNGYSFNEEWIKRLRLCFAEGEENFLEILLGAQTAQSILGERIQIAILTPSEGASSIMPH